MFRIGRLLFLTLTASVVLSAGVCAQETDPYSLLVPSYTPSLATNRDSVTLSLTGQLPNSCFGNPTWGFAGVDSGRIDVYVLPVLISLCDMCVFPTPPVDLAVP